MAQLKRPEDWSEEHVRRLWDWLVANQPVSYFSDWYGPAIQLLLELGLGIRTGSVLDFGCGNGHLLGHLLTTRLECSGLDPSEESIARVNRSFGGRPNWKGASVLRGIPSPLPAMSFDAIACIETVEHLREPTLHETLGEIHRLLKPGGGALITTPFAEDLEMAFVYCPFCDSSFHRMQHFQTFTEESLQALLRGHGFAVPFCKAINLDRLQPPRTRHGRPSRLKFAIRWLYLQVLRWRIRQGGVPFPDRIFLRYLAAPGRHLVAVARR